MKRYLERLGEVIRRYPDRTAFVAGDERISYAQVDDESARVYAYLKAQGIGREQFVLVLMPRDVHFFSCILGVMKAGAAFAHLEEGYPQKRVEYIREDTGAVLTLDTALLATILETCEPLAGYEKTDPHDAAYAVYTSGSTGNPKGVLQEYGGVDFTASQEPELDEYPERSFAQTAPVNFACSFLLMTMFTASARTIHVLPYDVARNLTALNAYLTEHDVQSVFLAPSAVRLLREPSPSLRTIYTAGEPANQIYFDGKPEVINGYGLSESGFFVCMTTLDERFDVAPIGPAMPGVDVFVADEDGSFLEGPCEGELCFRTDSFRGYIHLPEQTEKVVRAGVFHTGDLCRRDAEGRHYIVGRLDDMVKINGNRVEPAEIEAAAKRLLPLSWCAAKAFVDERRSFICLYYTDDLDFDETWLRKEMERYLPQYMIPTYFIHIDEIPVNERGKLVRRELPRPSVEGYVADYVAPAGELERRLCELFQSLLELERVGVTDDFYALGGDSLATMSLVAALDIEGISAMDVYRDRTPRRIAASYAQREAYGFADPEEVERAARERSYPLTEFQRNFLGVQLCQPETCVLNLPMVFSIDRTTVDVERFARAVQRAVDHHPIFRTVLELDGQGRVMQRYAADLPYEVAVEELSDEEYDELRGRINRPMRLLGVPLVQVRLFATQTQVHLVMIAHHIALDGTGINVILDSIARVYDGYDELATDTYFTYLDDESKKSQGTSYAEARTYFDETYGQKAWCNNLGPDHETEDFTSARLMFVSDVTPDVLRRVKERLNLSPNEFCATVALLSLAEVEGERDVMLNWVFQNRVNPVYENAAGMLIRLLPLGVTVGGDVAEVARQVSRLSRDAIAHSSYEWCLEHEDTYRDDALFLVYEGSILAMESMRRMRAKVGPLPSPTRTVMRRAALQVTERPQGLFFRFAYQAGLYDEAHAQAFRDALVRNIQLLSEI